MNISFLTIGIIACLSFGLSTASAQENNTQDFGISVEPDEKLIADLTPMLPYLAIVGVGIIVGIFVVLKKISSNDDDLDDDFEEDSEESTSLNPEFQDNEDDSESDSEDHLDPDIIIQNKLLMIINLQENKIGDHEKLEEIKKSLIDDGSFSLADTEYIEEKLEELEKKVKSKD